MHYFFYKCEKSGYCSTRTKFHGPPKTPFCMFLFLWRSTMPLNVEHLTLWLQGEVNVWRELVRWLLGRSPHTLPALGLCVLEAVSPKRGHPSVGRFLSMAASLKTRLEALLGSGEAIFLYPSHPEPAPFHYQTMLKPFNFAYTAIFNVVGLPVTQCPVGLSSMGTPLGVQVVAGKLQDHLTLAAACEIERAFGGWVPPSSSHWDGGVGPVPTPAEEEKGLSNHSLTEAAIWARRWDRPLDPIGVAGLFAPRKGCDVSPLHTRGRTKTYLYVPVTKPSFQSQLGRICERSSGKLGNGIGKLTWSVLALFAYKTVCFCLLISHL